MVAQRIISATLFPNADESTHVFLHNKVVNTLMTFHFYPSKNLLQNGSEFNTIEAPNFIPQSGYVICLLYIH